MSGLPQPAEKHPWFLPPLTQPPARAVCRVSQLDRVDARLASPKRDESEERSVYRASALPIDVYLDLADGVCYGTRNYSAADEGTLTRIDLNEAAIASINAARGGVFSVGGTDGGGMPSFSGHEGGFSFWSVDDDYHCIFANTSPVELDLRHGPLPHTRRLILWPRRAR